jgi:hypothetical protein
MTRYKIKRGPKKGSTKSVEHKRKISISCTGLKDSDETRKKKSDSAIGNKNARSGYKDFYRKYLDKAKQIKEEIISIKKDTHNTPNNKLVFLTYRFNCLLKTLFWIKNNKNRLRFKDTIKEKPDIGKVLFTFSDKLYPEELFEYEIQNNSIQGINPETLFMLCHETDLNT